MALFAKVAGLADDVVPAVLQALDKRCLAICSRRDAHPVAHGHGVGAADTFQAKVSLNLTIKKLAVVSSDNVPASCILNDKSVH